jgi:hypothetical protein
MELDAFSNTIHANRLDSVPVSQQLTTILETLECQMFDSILILMQLKPIFKMVKIPSVLFSANKELILIIKKVASGGEMSRITAVKAIL